MTKTIELKTIVTADEPDRTRKYTGDFHAIDGTTDKRSYLQYDEGRQGWTWGTKVAAYPWAQIVSYYSELFPLEEVPTVEYAITKTGTTMLKPANGEEFSIGAYSGLQDVTFFLQGGKDLVLHPDQAARLRDFLDEHIATTTR